MPQVVQTLATFLRASDGVGMQQADGPDVFMPLGLNDDPNQRSRYSQGNFSTHHSADDIKSISAFLGAVKVEYDTSAGAATKENVYSTYGNQDCFSKKAWDLANYPSRLGGQAPFWINPSTFARSMNQVEHIKKCLAMVRTNEANNGKMYSVVAVARPDLNYGPYPLQEPGFFGPVADGKFVRTNHDYIFAFKRDVLDNFFTRTSPLQCKLGEKCCGRIARSEDVFQFILGINEGCLCANDAKPKGTKWPANFQAVVCRPLQPDSCPSG